MEGWENTMDYLIEPLTAQKWNDLDVLFGEHGAFGGCWCMWWRLQKDSWDQNRGEGNRALLKGIVETGQVPGLLAYAGNQPVGWISIGPRAVFPRLERSRIAKPVDDRPVWSIVCFFVEKHHRRKGLTEALLLAAVNYARQQGARILEGYPVDKKGDQPAPFVYMGLAAAFRKVGFVEVARRSENRPIMRFDLEIK
jgi:GNAT superfamily N-acetyltransferase